jgi:hypothetical protein
MHRQRCGSQPAKFELVIVINVKSMEQSDGQAPEATTKTS